MVLASTMSNVDVVEHIKGMLPISLFSYVITAALFTVVGMQYSGNVSLEQVNLVMEALDKQFNITRWPLCRWCWCWACWRTANPPSR